VHGLFDLATNQALAAWERKNDIFGWGFLGGETLAALQRPQMDLHFDTFRRILMERIADAAGIVEDGSAAGGKKPATYKDAAGKEHPVPNLHRGLRGRAAGRAEDSHASTTIAAFLRRVGREGLATCMWRIARSRCRPTTARTWSFRSRSIAATSGTISLRRQWQAHRAAAREFPDADGVRGWQKQKIPLVRWRTTIGSWRSETQKNGKVYFKYKNSDVGPRIWKDIVASPVWIPPDGTPAKDLLDRRRSTATWGR
jgi:hypothetical protein